MGLLEPLPRRRSPFRGARSIPRLLRMKVKRCLDRWRPPCQDGRGCGLPRAKEQGLGLGPAALLALRGPKRCAPR
jgi:hypothetical protein